jgi:energy-coupling factor transport system substrate-specific component
VSWQLGSFALVIVALVLAFWWYERSRPSTKLLAVVATLAALAALGRDAFAAVPDVKPITAIVLISGVAFGAGPGFAVGAISALASNILLGEGPWTPWQMLGWGIVGVLGGALAVAAPRRLPSIALALACGAAAEVFNLILDLYTWTGTGSQSLRGFGVVLAAALVFDLTHVIASFVFALAFGPVLLRMLVRVRERLDVSWRPPPMPRRVEPTAGVPPSLAGLSVLAIVLALGAIALTGGGVARAAGAGAAPANRTVAEVARLELAREISFLARAQNGDGGFGGAAGQASSELYTGWVAMGLAASGRDPLSLRRGGHTVLDALRGEAGSLHGTGDLERTILALRACGVSVRSLAGGDPVARLLRVRARDGSFEHLSNLTAFAVFALRAAGYGSASAPVRAAARWLVRQQGADGGFGFAAKGGGSDIDDTAAVLQALRDAGVHGAAVERSVGYLARAQNLDGGYPQQLGGLSNAQSTAWAIQALGAAGRNPDNVKRRRSRSPVAYLESLIAPDGSVRYSRTGSQTPVWVTAQALTALAGRSFPIGPPRARRAARTARPVATPSSAPHASRAPQRRSQEDRAALMTRALSALIGALRASALGLAVSAAL